LLAFVSFFRAQSKTFETETIEVTTGLDNRLKTMPLTFNIALNQLPPGQYDCQVTVLDPTGQKGAFWRASVMLVP